MAKKRRKSRRSRSVRRNPPRSLNAVMSPIAQGFMNSFLVVGGMWAAQFVGKYLGDVLPKISDDTDMQAIFGQAVTAGVATGAAAFFLPPKVVPYIAVGSFAAPAKNIIRMANIGFINDGLGAYARRQRALGAYAQRPLLPAAGGIGSAYQPDQVPNHVFG